MDFIRYSVIALPILVTILVVSYIILEKSLIYGLYLLSTKLDDLLFKLRKKK